MMILNLKKIYMNYEHPLESDVKKFGFLFSVIFFIFSLYSLVKESEKSFQYALIFFAIAMITFFLAWKNLGLLKRPYKFWMIIGECFGHLNFHIFLLITYYLLCTPMAVVLKILGKDPLCRKMNHQMKTYRKAPQHILLNEHPF
jgi:hypothetical protein